MFSKAKVVDVAFALSFFYWGVAGFLHSYPALSVVRGCTSLLNIYIAYLVVTRSEPFIRQDMMALLKSIPSLVCGGVLFSLSKDFSRWGVSLEVLFGVGVTMVLVSFWSLGKSFSVFPSLRKIVKRGAYNVVRHPAYFGEILMCLACVLSVLSWGSIVVFLVYVPLLLMRIREEESLLMSDEVYREYSKTVRWRLVLYVY